MPWIYVTTFTSISGAVLSTWLRTASLVHDYHYFLTPNFSMCFSNSSGPPASRLSSSAPWCNLHGGCLLTGDDVHHVHMHILFREGFKKPRHGNFPWRGGRGYPPFPLTFFRWVFGNRTSVEGGRGVPPLSVKKKSIKNWPKNGVFWAKIAVFDEKISVFGNGLSVKGGGGTPLFR